MCRKFRNQISPIITLLKVAFVGLFVGLTNCGVLEAMEQPNNEFFTFEQLLHKVEKLPNHEIYVGSGLSAANERMYFAMEQVTQENILNWMKLGGGNRDEIFSQTIDQLREVYNHVQNNTEAHSYSPAYGSSDYYETLTTTLKKNKDKLQSYFEGNGAQAGCQGFALLLDYSSNVSTDYGSDGNIFVSYAPNGKAYVAYASKKPITGPFFYLGLNPAFSIEEFEQFYGDLIMYMCVRDNTPHPTTTNRGLQKNPLCNINGTYKYSGFLFQGFVEHAVATYFSNIKYTLLAPAPQLAKQLNETMETGEMFIGVDDFHWSKYSADIYQKFPTIALSEIGEILHEVDQYSFEEAHTIKHGAFAKFYI